MSRRDSSSAWVASMRRTGLSGVDQPLGNFWLLPSPSSGLCIPQPPAKLPCPCPQPSPHWLLTGQDQESQEGSNKEQPGPHGAVVPAGRGPVSPSSSPHPPPGRPPWGGAVALKQGLGRSSREERGLIWGRLRAFREGIGGPRAEKAGGGMKQETPRPGIKTPGFWPDFCH